MPVILVIKENLNAQAVLMLKDHFKKKEINIIDFSLTIIHIVKLPQILNFKKYEKIYISFNQYKYLGCNNSNHHQFLLYNLITVYFLT